jgi:hypothetical protein
MYLFGPAGCVDRAHTEPSGGEIAKLDAAPGNCVQVSGPIDMRALRPFVSAVIALAGCLAVTGIGNGTIEWGETDLGKSTLI